LSSRHLWIAVFLLLATVAAVIAALFVILPSYQDREDQLSIQRIIACGATRGEHLTEANAAHWLDVSTQRIAAIYTNPGLIDQYRIRSSGGEIAERVACREGS
jgi:hypothetical protein